MPKLVRSASNKAYFQNYNSANTHSKNKLARMICTAKAQPNNIQLQKANINIKYTRNRKSAGHICKGLYNALGFVENTMNGMMIKSKLGIGWYMNSNAMHLASEPNHGQSMRTQLINLGFKEHVRRKYKKTFR